MSPTFNCDKFVALLMNQEFAVDAFISLASKSPYPVSTDGTVGTLEGVIQKNSVKQPKKVIIIPQQFVYKIVKISGFLL